MLDAPRAFRDLFLELRNADLFATGPSSNINLQDQAEVLTALNKGAAKLPGLYLDPYVAPLQRNLPWVMGRTSPATLETLAGAIYDHVHRAEDVSRSLKCFLSVISNLYRSFLEPEPTAKGAIPAPDNLLTIPPLATFRPTLYLDNAQAPEYGPFTLPAETVEQLCGGKVAVVSLPSCYRNHPALCWGAIAHETGGHDILHAFRGMLWELRYGVRRLFYLGSDPKGQIPESREQFLGLLWQYWTEETASDVCALLNLGPAYCIGLPIYLAALNERIARHKQKSEEPLYDDPILTVSWPPSGSKNVDWVDYHPTDILKLNVLIGAIDCLPLSDPKMKDEYVKHIQDIIRAALENDRKRGNENRTVNITGLIAFKPGKIVYIDEKIDVDLMTEHARRVGRFIATESLKSLNGNCLQDLETWDNADDSLSENIKIQLQEKQLPDPARYLGDNAQLLAGSLRALYEQPGRYDEVNTWLKNALEISYYYDPIWGPPFWHPFSGGPAQVRQAIPKDKIRTYAFPTKGAAN